MNKEINRDVDGILGVTMPFTVDTRMVELAPVKLKDWTKFSLVYPILKYETLQELFRFSDAYNLLSELFALLTGKPEAEYKNLMDSLTQKDYVRFRQTIIEQNDLKFDKESEESPNQTPLS